MENSRGEPPQISGDYYPHYSLFQSSLFYDTDNIRIAFLTCKYDSLTTESGIRTFEYRKSAVECSEDLARYAQPTAKEEMERDRRWYSQVGPKCYEDLTHSIELPDKKDIKRCGTVSRPKDLSHNAGPLDKKDIEGGYTLFRPNWSDSLVRSIEPPDKNDIQSCGTVSEPKWPNNMVGKAEPLDKEDVEGDYTLFRPNWSDNLVRSIEPLDKKDIENCVTVSGPKWPKELVGNAEPLDTEDIEGCYTLFGPQRPDILVRSIEPSDKQDMERCCTVPGPMWPVDLAYNTEPLDKEDMKQCYTLFGPRLSDIMVRTIDSSDKEDTDRCCTVSGPMWPVDLACNVEPPVKEDLEGLYTLFRHTWSEDPVNIEALNKQDKVDCHTVSMPMCSEDLACSAEPLDIQCCHTVSWPKCFEFFSRSTKPPHKVNIKKHRAVSEPECSEDLACSAKPLGKEDKNNEPEEPEPEKRIITKGELYRDPDLFQSMIENVEPITPQPKKTKPWGYYDWTRQIWVHRDTGERVPMNRREELDEEHRQAWGEAWREERRGEWRGIPGGSQSGVAGNTTQRVGWPGGNPAAPTMTQRMGWQGGGLGSVGDAIHHPMTNDSNNSSQNPGFAKLSSRDVFRTNVLLFIMDFVKDDTEVHLIFDSALQQCERRQIKTMVSNIITDGNIELLGTLGQYDLVLDIQSHSKFQISVVSEGDEVTRWLSLYKEAPGHVYLVTPDDFLTFPDETNKHSSGSSINQSSRGPADHDNPFLRSIEKGLKKQSDQQCHVSETKKRPVSTPEEKMLEFFLEFVDSKYFTEMWFLGKFTEKQVQVINNLMNDVLACIDNLANFYGDKEMAKVFKSGEVQFELKEGSNGTTEIHKVSAKPPTEEQDTHQPGAQAGP